MIPATPRPWTLVEKDANPVGNHEYHILGPKVRVPFGTTANDFEAVHIAVVTGPQSPKRNRWAAPVDEADANATFIVEAVNAYDRLRAERAEAVSLLRKFRRSDFPENEEPLWNDIRALLAKMEAK